MTNAKETIIKSALKYLVKMQIEQGSVGFAVDNDHDHDCCWDDILAWIEAQPSEDCVSRSELQKTMDSLPLFRFVNNDHEEADDYYNCESVDMVIRNLPSVTPRRDLAETSQDCISREEMLKYQQYLHGKMSNEENHKLWNFIKDLPSVHPKYTDEEIDKAQAVEQAYVDKMVELAVEETKRPKGRWVGHGEHCENLGVVPSGLGAYEWCSNCDCGIDVREWHRNHYNFCPNCGADMRGEEDED